MARGSPAPLRSGAHLATGGQRHGLLIKPSIVDEDRGGGWPEGRDRMDTIILAGFAGD